MFRKHGHRPLVRAHRSLLRREEPRRLWQAARKPRLRLDGAGEENQLAIATCACALCRAKPTSGCATG